MVRLTRTYRWTRDEGAREQGTAKPTGEAPAEPLLLVPACLCLGATRLGQGWVAVGQGQDGPGRPAALWLSTSDLLGAGRQSDWAASLGGSPLGMWDLEGLSQRPPEPVASGPETQAPCSPERGRECNCVIHWSPRTDGRRTLIGKGIGPV